MHIGIAIRHPEHAHFYNHPIRVLEERGHEVSVFVREFRNTTALLAAFDQSYRLLADAATGSLDLLAGHLRYEWRLARRARRAGVDVLTSVGGRAVSHIGPLLGVPTVVFADWDPTAVDTLVSRLADSVCTPALFAGEYGPNQVVYDGLHELSYLHPARFQPGAGPGVRANGVTEETRAGPMAAESASVSPAEGRTHPGGDDHVGRLVAFSPAGGEAAWSSAVTAALAAHGPVAAPSAHRPDEGRNVAAAVEPVAVHRRLARADLCVTDLGTVATEAAVLGTPTVYVGTAPPRRCQYLAETYSLIQVVAPDEALEAVRTLLDAGDSAARWEDRRARLLAASEDVAPLVAETLVSEGGQ